ncbi:MAG: SHOCT domain-containing protein [Oscillospiraceae bacterium]|nr:SHOCT domain-containing protein [Oscillospiraceae bacterium]
MKNNSPKILSLVKLVIILLNAFLWARTLFSGLDFFGFDLAWLVISSWPLIVIFLVLVSNAVISIMIISKGQSIQKSIHTISLALSIISLPLALYIFYTIYSGIGRMVIIKAFSLIIMLILSIMEFTQYNTKEQKISSTTSLATGTLVNLVKYKELLDMGAITQEEFDEMKTQLLNSSN